MTAPPILCYAAVSAGSALPCAFVAFVPRRDGMVFQVIGDDDYYGYDDASATPDRAEAELAVTTIARLFA